MDRDNAQQWTDTANKNKRNSFPEPQWSWDCGLKLDYDGGILHVSSRFYQSDDDIFDGSVSFLIGDTELFCKEFPRRHIDVLREDVDRHVAVVTKQIEKMLLNNVDASD